MVGRLRICLAGSGGGHVRQLLDLEPLWSEHDHYFLSEDTALGRALRKTHAVDFVAHVALGQAKLGAPFKMAAAGLANFFQSARSVFRRRPQVVITTGAGAMFFTVLWARLLGAKIVLIDSMARVHRPSAFARLAGPFAHIRISQSRAAGRAWCDALVFDSLKLLPDTPPPKEPLLFATVGATLPFDRLIEMVETAKHKGLLPERIIAQCGEGGRRSDTIETVESLGFDEVKDILRRADFVVCHGGTGSLVTAAQNGCRTIAVPRRFARGEHYDDHQEEIAEAFHERGLAIAVDDQDEFEAAIAEWRTRTPQVATRDASAMMAYLRKLLTDWDKNRSAG
ncbi:hypothetical protein BFL28_05805 [Sphingomonas turrisvirgatae]|uniref:Glycosyl transferase family 28 C-terminal domain-containing protein n=2 Tax=Sphingomonas turrisvirgatae TaxID=1888892 RepID=A0A1E3LS29_9SPHN|nr:hypothetical protein BFL28_05805 [Sphingomonas turrisvirgatae]